MTLQRLKRTAVRVRRTIPTRRRDFLLIGRELGRALRRPTALGVAVLVFLGFVALLALPGRVDYVTTIVASDLPIPRKLSALAALLPFWNVRYPFPEGILLVLVGVLLSANVALTVARISDHRAGATEGAGSLFGIVLTVLGSGCSVCGSVLVPVAGFGSAVAVFPLGGLEIVLLAVVVLLSSAFALSRRGRCEV